MKYLKLLAVAALATFTFDIGGCSCTDGEACDFVQLVAQPVYAQQFVVAQPLQFVQQVQQVQAYSAPIVLQQQQYGVQQFAAFSAPVQQVIVRQRFQRVRVRQAVVVERRGFVGRTLDNVFGRRRAIIVH